jgi:hypothetical protein
MCLPLSYLSVSLSSDEDDAPNRVLISLIFQVPHKQGLTFLRSKVEAIRIGCDGEVQELDVPKFQPVMISAYDRMFRNESRVSQLSRFIGIPIVARRHRLDSDWEINLRNSEASHLFRNCNIASSRSDPTPFGRLPNEWPIDVGPVIIARLDRKPLHPLHAAAIASFCSRHLQRHFQLSAEMERTWRNVPGSRDWIFDQRAACLSEATAAKFAEYYDDYKLRRVIGYPHLMDELYSYQQQLEHWQIPPDEIEPRPEWADVPSPFDI